MNDFSITIILVLGISNLLTLLYLYRSVSLVDDLRYLLNLTPPGAEKELTFPPFQEEMYDDDYLLRIWDHVMANDLEALEKSFLGPKKKKKKKEPKLSIVKKKRKREIIQ